MRVVESKRKRGERGRDQGRAGMDVGGAEERAGDGDAVGDTDGGRRGGLQRGQRRIAHLTWADPIDDVIGQAQSHKVSATVERCTGV